MDRSRWPYWIRSGIVDKGSGFQVAGTALDLYSITHKGVERVRGSPDVLPPIISGVSNEPLVSIAAEHDLVYVVYVRVSFGEPILIQFRITAKGLVYEWEQVLQTGDAGLQGSSIEAVATILSSCKVNAISAGLVAVSIASPA